MHCLKATMMAANVISLNESHVDERVETVEPGGDGGWCVDIAAGIPAMVGLMVGRVSTYNLKFAILLISRSAYSR